VSLSIRIAEAADRPRLFELFGKAFGAPASPAEWAWKYDQNPNRAASVVAVKDAWIVGFYGGFGTRYRGAEGNLPGVSASDVMTDPAARTLGRRALFATLVAGFCRVCTDAGMPFGFGFPNDRHRLAGEKVIGYRSVEPAAQWERPLQAETRRGRLRLRLLRARAGEPFGRAHEALSEVLHARAGWRTERTPRALNWRFLERPGGLYTTIQLVDLRGRSRAYAVVRLVGDRALLVDVQARDESDAEWGDLLDAVAENLSGTSATRLELRAASRSRLARAAPALGFAPIPTDTYFEVRPFDPAFDLDNAGRAFDYRFCDHEIF
jgi:hypothetical protein